jgi:hypothetical protein
MLGRAVPIYFSAGHWHITPAGRNAYLVVEGKCFYCGGVEQLFRNCPQARAAGNELRRYMMRGAVLRVENENENDSVNKSAKDLSMH